MADTTLDPTIVTAERVPTVEYTGQASRQDWASNYNAINFAMKQKLLELNVSIPVQVTAVHTQTTFSGYVDVEVLVKQIDATGKPWDYGTLYNLPYNRLQGGVNAVIIDPAIGDIGFAVFASRDISSFKNPTARANSIANGTNPKAAPGSHRTYDLSDGMYIGGILNKNPTRYIQFTDTGIIIEANDTLTINSAVQINGNLTVSGTTITGSGGTSINLNTHHHSDPQGGNTGGPIT